jgi:integration host factor subunit beta
MTKSELVEMIAESQGQITRREAEVVVNTIFSAIGDALVAGGRVELRGFGSFSTKRRNARIGRNPKTGESVQVPSKIVPQFKPGKELRERVDAQGA